MKKFWSEFFMRGTVAAAGGPVVLAIIYAILGATDVVDAVPVKEMCLGIFSITLLAMIAGGMTAVYQMEQLPLPTAILLHGAGLYVAYLLAYLINGWLQRQIVSVLIFTGIFVAGYALIWLCIYLITKSNTEKINKKLSKQS